MKKILFILFFIVSVVISTPAQEIKIASFNLHQFGDSQVNNQKVMEVLAKIMEQFDLIAVQEIQNKKGNALEKLDYLLGDTYNYVVGPGLGAGSRKDQYAYIYRIDKLELLFAYTYNDDHDSDRRNETTEEQSDGTFHYEPLICQFQLLRERTEFSLINIHIDPDEIFDEVPELPKVVEDLINRIGDEDVIILGDFNTIDEHEVLLKIVFPENEYKIIITEDFDTTVAEGKKNENQYDRIIVTNSLLQQFTENHGVFHFDKEKIIDFDKYGLLPKDISDHYPVFVNLKCIQ